MLVRRRTVLGGIIPALLVAAGCGSSDDGDGIAVSVSSRLSRAQSCEDLLTRIQADAEAKVKLNGKDAKEQKYWSRGGLDFAVDDAVGAPPPNSASNGADGATESESPESYSETNTQVQGVDEADIVKTDGDHVYLLHGNQLFVLDSWPAAATTIAGQAEIEGYPLEMFVSGGRALVYSQTADPNPDEAQLYRPDCVGCEWAYCDAYYGGNFVKLTVLDVSAGEPAVLHESYSEGSYVSSRMHGTLTRGVIQGGFKGPGLYPYINYWDENGNERSDMAIQADISKWEREVIAAIAETKLTDWLPRSYVEEGGELVPAEPDCTAFYVPDAAATEFGITKVTALDLAAEQPAPADLSIVGSAHEIYANHEVLLLAQNDYSWRVRDAGGSQTALHLFDITASQLRYVGSGYAPGTIHDQFSLDEREGVIRLSTTQEVEKANDDWEMVNWVVTMKPDATGELTIHGKSEQLAPGETIYSTRFIGDMAYVVTFRQMDPLFAIDLQDPKHPTLLGELHIPGFSDYMHPLGDEHLLTIGRDIDPDTQADKGLLLQIFDVSDPTEPQQTFTHSYNQDGWSEANHEHKAFNYYAPLQLLAFPYTSYSGAMSSSLELFRVTAETGFEPLGSISHGAFANDACYDEMGRYWTCNYNPDVRRGLFIEDYVYSISYGGILVHDLDDLSTPVASVDLPEPQTSVGYYYW